MDIKKYLLERAGQSDRKEAKGKLQNNGMKLKSPILYVLIGNQNKEALESLQENMKQKLVNAEGAIFLVIESLSMESKELHHEGSDESEQEDFNKNIRGNKDNKDNKDSRDSRDNKESKHDKEETNKVFEAGKVVRLQMNSISSGAKRGKITCLLEEEDFLKVLNEAILKVKQLILNQGKCFNYWEQIYVSFATLAREPLNILLPDLTLLIKSKLEQDFKQVSAELYVLLEEGKEDSKPMNKAICYSFFKELEAYQSPQFHYEKAIELVDDELRLKIKADAPIFDIVYILSDKNERGQVVQNANKKHYETMVATNLLKNRDQKAIDSEPGREQYNQNVFISNIQELGENRFCTAQLAKVRKPDTGIYLSIVYHLFKYYVKMADNHESRESAAILLTAVGLDKRQREEIVKGCMPEAERLEDIYSLITNPVSFKEIKALSFSEAEHLLYGRSAEEFFRVNFEEFAGEKLNTALTGEIIEEDFITRGINNPSFGPVAFKMLFNQEIFKRLEAEEEAYQAGIRQYESELISKSEKVVGEKVGNTFNLFDKKCVRAVKGQLIHEIYEIKYRLLEEELKLEAVIRMKTKAKQFLDKLDKKLEKLAIIEHFLLQMLENINKYEEEYLVQNVKEYYKEVIKEKMSQLQSKWGNDCLYDEKYIGPIAEFLEENEEAMIIKLCETAEREILSDEKYFGISFEEELLARANMHIDYEDKEVVAKGTLYDLLQESLEENSLPCVHLDTTLCSHSYKEKYFFGDSKSEFISYAYQKDQSSHSYKVGTVYEARDNAIEKLQLMGGFRLSDMLFTKSAERYYKAYIEQGYCFRGEE